MNPRRPFPIALLLAAGCAWLAAGAAAQTQPPTAPQGSAPSFERVAADLQQQVGDAYRELSRLREQIADDMLPLNQRLRELENALRDVKSREQEVNRLNDTRSNELTNRTREIEVMRDQANYLSSLLDSYCRSFESRVNVAERQRWREQIAAAELARDNTKLTELEHFQQHFAEVDTSLAALEEALGGARFDGRAVANGVIKPGTFVVVGPTALFRSADGLEIGAVEERTGSEPLVLPYRDPADRDAAAQLALGTGGAFPIDSTLGDAQKVETIQETWWEHVRKGGPVMVPMFVLAGAALLVVLLKWLSLSFVRRPNKQQVAALLDYIDGSDYASAAEQAEALRGPAGRMLHAGARHLGEPRELVEEVMFEQVMSTRLRLNGWLPFVAICATSAPLLGLLGTVTGIMNTFALMTEFGTGDPKMLSSGISEALITTEYGLIVAIPSLLLHAFLSRKARSIVDHMERVAVQFMNHVHSPARSDVRDSVGVA